MVYVIFDWPQNVCDLLIGLIQMNPPFKIVFPKDLFSDLFYSSCISPIRNALK